MHVAQSKVELTSRRCSALPHDADRLWLLLPRRLWDLSDHESGVCGGKKAAMRTDVLHMQSHVFHMHFIKYF